MAAEYDYTQELEPTTAKGKRLEAEALRDEAQRLVAKAIALEVAAEGPIVQVAFSRVYSQTYAYHVPDGLTVEVDDIVVVQAPGGRKIVRVVATGRGGYSGPVKSILGRVITQDDDVNAYDRGFDRGYGVCPDCGYGYFSENSAPCGGTME